MNTSLNPFASIKSGDRLFVHGGAATPNKLLELLVAEADRLENVELIHLHTIGEARYADPEFAKSFRVANLFVGPNMRKKMNLQVVDYLPCFLSEIPALFRSRKRPLNAALIHVSQPDRNGFCNLGTSVDIALAAIETAPLIIAQINSQMPRVHGDGFIHISQINHWIAVDEPLPEVARPSLNSNELAIGQHVASLIEDGSTLQVGIGNIPDAILSFLKDHSHLGVHTEMWSDGILDLIKCGAIDNSQKKVHPGKTVSGFITGTKAVYEFIHDNPSVAQLDIGYINNPSTIARNPKAVSINSAVEIDLTGQICADSIGSRIISGVGGQMDFMRGSAFSEGGKPIIAMLSRTHGNIPRIVPILKPGAGVVTSRAHVHYVATEFGVVDLYGKTLSERAKALIGIAHPEDRSELEKNWKTLSHTF